MSEPAGKRPRVWAMPMLLAAATVIGLAAALCGEGLSRWAAWFALGVPLAVAARHVMRATCDWQR
ncbi:hypothetical protein [Caballeronia sp. LZ035]|uniref:hypothetical protein n=1 Tax=Caballeronia sp. LZ035 TaxID=3038568 RepID=UPI002856F265|nr:hypothetical protein [Caballeronia sp. LZ035]MDR5760581.1 hypothetical protein [Caballeronia sp. LZ035]